MSIPLLKTKLFVPPLRPDAQRVSRPLGAEEKAEPEGKDVQFETNIASKYIEFYLGEKMKGKDVDLYIEKEYLATFNVGKKGVIRIKKSNPMGKSLLSAQKYGEKIRILKT